MIINSNNMKQENYLEKVFGNSAWMIASKIINIVIGLAVSICITRYLGTEQKGAMANAQAITGFWGFIASGGLLDIMISRFSKERNNSGTLAGSGMLLMLIGGICAFLLSVVSAVALGVTHEVLVYVIVCGLAYLFQFLTVYEYWFYSNSNSKYYAISQSIIHIVFLAVRFIGVPLKVNLSYFIWAISLETITIYLSLILCYRQTKCYFIGELKVDNRIVRELFKLSLPMIAMGFATTIYMKVDQMMVGKMMGNSELGIYSVSVTLAEYWYFIPATIYSSFLPIITESFGNKEEFRRRLQQFADIMSLIGYTAVIGVMVLGHWGIVTLYGREFEASAYILMVYIWSGIFTCMSYSGQAYYIIHKDTKTIMWINIVGAGLNFILNLLLISRFGSIGAALATLLEYMIVAFGQMLILRKKYGELYIIQLKSLFPFMRMAEYVKKIISRRSNRN